MSDVMTVRCLKCGSPMMGRRTKPKSWAANGEVRFLPCRLCAALDVLEDLVDDAKCDLSELGHCQAHGWLETEPKCPHARAQKLLQQRKKR